MNFAYKEGGERKQALVKLRVCPDCAIKLNYRKLKQQEKEAQELRYVYMCIYVYNIYVYMYIYIYIYVYLYVYVYMYIQKDEYVCVYALTKNKRALVKLRMCPECAIQLNYQRLKQQEKEAVTHTCTFMQTYAEPY